MGLQPGPLYLCPHSEAKAKIIYLDPKIMLYFFAPMNYNGFTVAKTYYR